MSDGKTMIIHLISGLMKKKLYKMSQYFPNLYQFFWGDMNVKAGLSIYATKNRFKKSNRNWHVSSSIKLKLS